jgi:hypothetical protein
LKPTEVNKKRLEPNGNKSMMLNHPGSTMNQIMTNQRKPSGDLGNNYLKFDINDDSKLDKSTNNRRNVMDRNSLPQKPNTFYNQEALTNVNNYIKDNIFDAPQANFNKKENPESWQNSATKSNLKRSETAPEAGEGSNKKRSSFEIETLQIKPPKQTSGARNLIFDFQESQQNDNRKEGRLGALVEAHNFISKFEEIVPTMNAKNNFSRILDLNNSISNNNH